MRANGCAQREQGSVKGALDTLSWLAPKCEDLGMPASFSLSAAECSNVAEPNGMYCSHARQRLVPSQDRHHFLSQFPW